MPQKKKPSKTNVRYHIPNVVKTLSVLEMLAKSPDGMAFSDIISASKLTKISVFRIICTLEDSGYLQHNAENGKISISQKLVSLALSSIREENIAEKSRDILREICEHTKETAILGALFEDSCLLIDQAVADQIVNLQGKLGSRAELYCTAPGKAIMAFAKDSEIERLANSASYKTAAKNTITSRKALIDELAKIRADGYAVDNEEAVDGVYCVAAPIFGMRRQVAAAVWVTGLVGRINASDFKALGLYIRKKADEISERLGYRP